MSVLSLFPEMVDNVVRSQAWLAVAQTLITGGQQSDYWSFQGYISLSIGWTLAVHRKHVCVCVWCVVCFCGPRIFHLSWTQLTNYQPPDGHSHFLPFSLSPVRLLLFYQASLPERLFSSLITYFEKSKKFMLTFYYFAKSCIFYVVTYRTKEL